MDFESELAKYLYVLIDSWVDRTEYYNNKNLFEEVMLGIIKEALDETVAELEDDGFFDPPELNPWDYEEDIFDARRRALDM